MVLASNISSLSLRLKCNILEEKEYTFVCTSIYFKFMYKVLLYILAFQWAEFVLYYFNCLLLATGLVQSLLNSFHLFVMATDMQFVPPNIENYKGVLILNLYRKFCNYL